MKVVCDTNVFFSAIVVGGAIEDILTAANSRKITIFISPQILFELSQVLKTKAGWQDYQINTALYNLGKICRLIRPEQIIKIIKSDDSDNRILECAVAAKADYIITGDKKHLLPLKKYKSINIVSPRQFLTRVLYRQND